MIPKFILGDNTDFPESVFVIHTEYPRFVLDLADDNLEWFDDLEAEDPSELEDEVAKLIGEAQAFYDREISRYDEEE